VYFSINTQGAFAKLHFCVMAKTMYKSIHVDNLPELLTQLVSGPLGQWYLEKENKPLIQSNVTSHLLREYLLAGGKHPAREYHHLFSREFPHAALSYEWKLGMLDVSNVLRDPLVLNHPELLMSVVEKMGRPTRVFGLIFSS
jgi:hypothetical protein